MSTLSRNTKFIMHAYLCAECNEQVQYQTPEPWALSVILLYRPPECQYAVVEATVPMVDTITQARVSGIYLMDLYKVHHQMDNTIVGDAGWATPCRTVDHAVMTGMLRYEIVEAR